MADRPVVSVCIPAYEQPEMFRRALVSALDQDYGDFEVVITDDSRDDAVAAVVEEHAGDDRIRYLRNRSRLGSPENWNHAIEESAGEYVKVLHHDDWFAGRESLGRYVALMNGSPRARLGFSASRVCGPDGNLKRIASPSERDLARIAKSAANLFPRNVVGAPSATIYRRAAGVRFDPTLRWIVDLDFYVRLLASEPAIAFDPDALVCTTDGAAHQVTREFEGNSLAEVPEWVALYRKLHELRLARAEHLYFLFMLFRLHRIGSVAALRATGVTGPIPRPVAALVRLRPDLAARIALRRRAA